MKHYRWPLGLLILLSLPLRPQAQLNEFQVGMYTYSNNFDQAYLDPMVDLNINLVFPNIFVGAPTPNACNDPNGPDLSPLDLLQSNGMRIIIPDTRVDFWRCDPAQYDPTGAAIDLCYFDHPAVAGFSVSDELSSIDYATAAASTYQVQTANPNWLGFTNLLSAIANNQQLAADGWAYTAGTSCSPITNWTTCTYPEYNAHVRDFMLDVKPRLVTADHYPFWEANFPIKTRTFYTLDILARNSTLYDIPIGWVLTPMQVIAPSTFAAITAPALFRYQIFAPTSYGAKAIIYWARETTTGTPDILLQIPPAVRSELADIHKNLRDHSCVLMNLDFEHATHYNNFHPRTNDPAFAEDMPPLSSLSDIAQSSIAVSHFNLTNPLLLNGGHQSLDTMALTFLHDQQDGDYFWVFNKSTFEPVDVELQFNGPKRLLNILSDQFCPSVTSTSVTLLPGEAKLFQISDANPTTNFCTAPTWQPYDSESYLAENINIAGPGCNYLIPANVTVDYKTNETVIAGEFLAKSGSEAYFYSAPVNPNCGYLKMAPAAETSSSPEVPAPTLAFRLVPNPSTGDFQVISTGKGTALERLEVWNLNGQKVFEIHDASTESWIRPGTLPDGLYLIRFFANGNPQTIRLLLQH